MRKITFWNYPDRKKYKKTTLKAFRIHTSESAYLKAPLTLGKNRTIMFLQKYFLLLLQK